MKNQPSLETIIENTKAPQPVFDIFSEKLSFKEFIETEDDINKFTNHLINLAEEISPDEEKLLFYFFQTSLNYLRALYHKDYQNLQTLALLTEFLEDGDSYNESLYDQFIKEMLQKTHFKKGNTVRDNYNILLKMRNRNSSKTIKTLFWRIIANYQPPKK